MLEHRYRFHGHNSLRYLYGRGKTYRIGILAARVVANPQRLHSRFAVVVTKKVTKVAPRRNRIRRRIYEIIRTNWDAIAPGHDVVITIYDVQAETLPHAQLQAAVIALLERAGMWQGLSNDGKAD